MTHHAPHRPDQLDFPDWASNFYHSPLTFEGIRYDTAEAAFQSAKTTDMLVRQVFGERLVTPGKAKQMGRKLPLREDWERVKDDVMLDVLRAKFAADTLATYLLLHTDDLIEWTMWHDNYWGVCLCGRRDCHGGMNRLGSLLGQVRRELQGKPKLTGREVPYDAVDIHGGRAVPHSDMVAGRDDEDWVRRFAGGY